MKKEKKAFRIGSFLFHLQIKRHGNGTGLELYIGKLSKKYLQNLKIIKGATKK